MHVHAMMSSYGLDSTYLKKNAHSANEVTLKNMSKFITLIC